MQRNARNNFRLVGTCFNNAKTIIQNDTKYSSVILCLKDDKKTKYAPIYAYDDVGDILLRLGRKGNEIAVSGFIDSTEYFNKITGITSVRIRFVAEDIMILKKAKKTSLSRKRLEDLIGLFDLES